MSDNKFRDANSALVECLNSLNAEEILTKEEADVCVTMFDNFLTSCVDIGIIKDYDLDDLEEFLGKLVLK